MPSHLMTLKRRQDVSKVDSMFPDVGWKSAKDFLRRSLKKLKLLLKEKLQLYHPSHSKVCLVSELDDASSDALLSESVAAERWHKRLLENVEILDVL